MSTPSVTDSGSFFQALKLDEKCLKCALITALVVSILSSIGGIGSFSGLIGVGTLAVIWTASSIILAAGLLFFVIQSCRKSGPQEDPSFSKPIKHTVSLPETVDGLTKEDFAKLTPKQVIVLIKRGENVSKLLSPVQFRWLFEFLISPEIKGSLDIDDEQQKELIPALKPEQLARFDSDELIDCFHLFTPYQIYHFDYSKIDNQEIANLFLESEYSQITVKQIFAWLRDDWELKLSGHQIAKLPFDRITDTLLDKIFPLFCKNYNERLDFEKKLEEISKKNIQKLLYVERLEGFWLRYLPEKHLKELDFSRLSNTQRSKILPVYDEKVHFRRRCQCLSDTQRRCFDRDIQALIKDSLKNDE